MCDNKENKPNQAKQDLEPSFFYIELLQLLLTTST